MFFVPGAAELFGQGPQASAGDAVGFDEVGAPAFVEDEVEADLGDPGDPSLSLEGFRGGAGFSEEGLLRCFIQPAIGGLGPGSKQVVGDRTPLVHASDGRAAEPTILGILLDQDPQGYGAEPWRWSYGALEDPGPCGPRRGLGRSRRQGIS